MQKVSDPAPSTCPHCQKGTPERIFSASFGVQFKGEGFYSTDYKAKEGSACCQGGCKCSKQKKEQN